MLAGTWMVTEMKMKQTKSFVVKWGEKRGKERFQSQMVKNQMPTHLRG